VVKTSSTLQSPQTDLEVRTRLDFQSKASLKKKERIATKHDLVTSGTGTETEDVDRNCIFRDSPIYRSVYVYPSPGEAEWNGDILSKHGKARTDLYPWQEIDNRTKTLAQYHYRNRDSRATQYTTEILVREILTNNQSCLRTLDPDKATLFYVPYMASIEWHNGTQYSKSFATSSYGQAIMDAMDNNFTLWEERFGWTSKYWKRRHGADHILVMSERRHGLWHPRERPGNFVYIQAQKQLAPPIIISGEISRTFVQMYPKCAQKNIVMPYPNTDGRWFNSKTDHMARTIAGNASMTNVLESLAALPGEKELFANNLQDPQPRVLAQYYKAGKHGSCFRLRTCLEEAFDCSPTKKLLEEKKNVLPKGFSFPHAYRQSTFCPCPGGDSPSAKRMFDALFAGCIPVILSHDFVWPFTTEILAKGSQSILLNPTDFSIRVHSAEYMLNDPCGSDRNRTLQAYMERIPAAEIERLRQGVRRAAQVYAYYQQREELPDNPLRENTLPDGGATQALVGALAERASGKMWPECEQELKVMDPAKDNVNQFKC
jgi:hypothetical protein